MPRMNCHRYVFLLALLFSFSCGATTIGDGWFGYWANGADISENYDHTNITMIWGGYPTTVEANAHILSELSQAQLYGVKAMVEVSPFLFSRGTNGACPYSINSNAATMFDDFVSSLVSNGYLVPGDPSASVVAAFYPVDEPAQCGLKDVGGSANPALVNAINVIRTNTSTYNFPLAMVVSKKYNQVAKGIELVDWVGMDNYGTSTSNYISKFQTFETTLSPGQRSFLVPLAAQGGMMSGYGNYHDPDAILDAYLNSSRAIGIMPFLWRHWDTTGVSGIPFLKAKYKIIGDFIANGVPLPLRGALYCSGSGGMFYCHISASRGVPPYSYDWSPAPWLGGSTFARYNFSCGTHHMIEVTITDAASHVLSSQTMAYCRPGSLPLDTPNNLDRN